MDALDGNAIGGQLFEYFGNEMTMAPGTCAHCGAKSLIAELRVYLKAPGTVARCPRCGSVVVVLGGVRGAMRADFRSFRLRDASAWPRAPPGRENALAARG